MKLVNKDMIVCIVLYDVLFWCGRKTGTISISKEVLGLW